MIWEGISKAKSRVRKASVVQFEFRINNNNNNLKKLIMTGTRNINSWPISGSQVRDRWFPSRNSMSKRKNFFPWENPPEKEG